MFARLAVLLLAVGAAGCSFGPCPEGCKPEMTYTPSPKTNTAYCRGLLDVVEIEAPWFHSCHANVQEPAISTPDVCTEFLGRTVCLKAGTCGVTRKMDMMGMTCQCPPKPACSSNADCPSTHFCRPTCDGNGRECAAYSKEGEGCGGLTRPCHQGSCAPGLTCVGERLHLDVPGKCAKPTLKLGDLCYSFCEDGSCSLDRKGDCPSGTTCRGIDNGMFHFNSYLYCLPECPAGEEYDQLAGKCVAVTCDAKGACPAGTKCVPNDGIACVRAPCPRFECQ